MKPAKPIKESLLNCSCITPGSGFITPRSQISHPCKNPETDKDE